ncbi:PREDICTED: protein CHUP1, chloroplastic [Nelumbo nucifera]|uniref:Protein CHUP1, chloroplastic n=2 Tax=Nelumbo nucifera TaxID=4432 RepID=A0A1U7Z5W3_NELNU|nr:PREDICTED: protein CHUP1, chloroplastic [Nelumbo nucifera]DAD28654.1 TPA_asm: hypothetical protein HUJ06_030122 [Nelumbo nucifera]
MNQPRLQTQSFNMGMGVRPIYLKAGIPLALSFAGFVYGILRKRRRLFPRVSSEETEESSSETDNSLGELRHGENLHNLNLTPLACREEEELDPDTEVIESIESSVIGDGPDFEDEFSRLRNWVVAIQDRERELEKEFLCYCRLRDQEVILLQLRNMLMLEIVHVKFLGLLAGSMEAESRRLEALLVEYLKAIEQLGSARLENRLLRRKVRKLSRICGRRYHALRRQAVALRAKEAELLENHEALEQRDHILQGLVNENMELKKTVDQLQEEKKGLMEKLESAETSASSISKTDAEETEKGDADQLLTELEQLRKEHAADTEELIYLQWINACLRHELLKIQEQQCPRHERSREQQLLEFEENEEKRDSVLEHDSNPPSTVSENHHSCMDIETVSPNCSKKHRLLHRLKRWVEGSEKCRTSRDEKDKHQSRCLGRLSVSDEAMEPYHTERKSCSSV